MSLRGQWAMWMTFAALVCEYGFAEAYGWLYVSAQMTVQYNRALAAGRESGLDLKVLE
jgi:hypothetical protein